MIELIAGVIKIISLLLGMWNTKNVELKKAKEAKVKEIKDAIKSGDTSAITASLSGM